MFSLQARKIEAQTLPTEKVTVKEELHFSSS
jgi:hypothetical protein